MIILSSTSDKIRVITSGTADIDVQSSYVDWNGTTATPDRKNTAITTATTTDVVAAPGASTQRTVKRISATNKHASASNTVTILHTDGTTTSQLAKATLLAGESLLIDDKGVVFKYDSSMGVYGAGANSSVAPPINDFRLSGVSATPVMTADSTALSTIYLAQYRGNRIALYDGTAWQLATPAAEVSLAVTGRTTDLPFDVFAYLNAGVVTLEFLNWTDATTRATGLSRLDGVWTKTGDATRRYLGSVRARSATTFHWVLASVDAPAKLDLFNADNRMAFRFSNVASTDSWTYTVATWRQAQASANYQVDIMVGLQEECFEAFLQVSSRNSTISIPRQVGIGFDSTTAFSGSTAATANTVASIEAQQTARLANQPVVGRHYYAWLEISTATGTCTWIGDDGAARLQSGMSGSWKC